jgi:hypothetical protein
VGRALVATAALTGTILAIRAIVDGYLGASALARDTHRIRRRSHNAGVALRPLATICGAVVYVFSDLFLGGREIASAIRLIRASRSQA